MKTLKNLKLIVIFMIAVSFAACSKKGDNVDPENGQLTNSAQLFLSDNTTLTPEGNDAVPASYTDGKLSVSFAQNGVEMSIQIPNYDINIDAKDYDNSTAAVSLKKDNKTYITSNIFIPVVVGNPPIPQFVSGKTITIKANNLKIDDHTTDVSLLIPSGSTLITTPVSNGQAAVYSSIDFVQGDGGKPNFFTMRIKH